MKKLIIGLVACAFFITNVNAFDWQGQHLAQKALERAAYWSKRGYIFNPQTMTAWSMDQKMRRIEGTKYKKKLKYNQKIIEKQPNPSLYYGRGDKINFSTGERIIDMGGGNKMNLSTGDYILSLGGGGKLNLVTGERIIDMGGGNKMNLGIDNYIIREGNIAGALNVSPEKSFETESPKEMVSIKTIPIDTVSSNLTQNIPFMVSGTEKTLVGQATTLTTVPLASPPKETIISKKDLTMKNKIMSEKEGKDNFVHIDLQTRIVEFLNDYCWSYEQKDLEKLSTFFTFNAVENGKPFRFWHSKYHQTFDSIDSIEYDIELERYTSQEESGLVKIDGIFHVRAKLVGSKKLRKKSGQIFMALEPDGNSFKVRQLDY